MKGTELQPGDRVRHVRILEGTVLRRTEQSGLVDGLPGRVMLLRLEHEGRTFTIREDSDGYELLERPAPPEPPKGSVVRDPFTKRVWVRDDVLARTPWRSTNSDARTWADIARVNPEILHEEPAP